MADPEERYSWNESLDRILRILKGDTVSETPEALPPPKRSSNESLSMIAELLNGTLEGEQAIVPIGMNAYGMLYNTDALTTGTSLSSGTWYYVDFPTGTNILNMTETHSVISDTLTTTKAGKYWLTYDVNFAGTKDAEYEFAFYTNGAVIAPADQRMMLRASGTYQSISGTAIDNQTATHSNGVIVRSSTHNANFAVRAAQFCMKLIR